MPFADRDPRDLEDMPVRVPRRHKQQLEQLARRNGTTRSEETRRAIAEYLERAGKETSC